MIRNIDYNKIVLPGEYLWPVGSTVGRREGLQSIIVVDI